jgi:hypothetical protein
MGFLFGNLLGSVSLHKFALEEGHPADKSFDNPPDGHQHRNVFLLPVPVTTPSAMPTHLRLPEANPAKNKNN